MLKFGFWSQFFLIFFFLQSLKILWDDLHEQKALSLVPVRDVGIILVLVEGEVLMQLWICTNLGLNAGSLPSDIDEDNAHYISCNDFSAVMSGISLKRMRGSNQIILLILTFKVQHGH